MKKAKKIFASLFLVILVSYGAGRLYFQVTGGFRIAHITSNFEPDPRWITKSLSEPERALVDQILSQPFFYLGKGCQSYVFLSEDREYVIKFFKYQRFRPHPLLVGFSFLPLIEKYLQDKKAKKQQKLDDLYTSWKIAFNHFKKGTGLVYVHLNKTDDLDKSLIISDKMGIHHIVDMDQMAFLIQKKADMLCDTLDQWMKNQRESEAKELLTHLFKMILEEYHQGFADNDHALMQNTGVIEGRPVHIDVGQFVINEAMRAPLLYRQELFNKFYKFRLWLQERYPSLFSHVNQMLQEEIGEPFFTMKHIPKQK